MCLVADDDGFYCVQISTLNPIVGTAAPVTRKMYQCDLRQYASDFQSVVGFLSSVALAPNSTSALCSVELSLIQVHDRVVIWRAEQAIGALSKPKRSEHHEQEDVGSEGSF